MGGAVRPVGPGVDPKLVCEPSNRNEPNQEQDPGRLRTRSLQVRDPMVGGSRSITIGRLRDNVESERWGCSAQDRAELLENLPSQADFSPGIGVGASLPSDRVDFRHACDLDL